MSDLFGKAVLAIKEYGMIEPGELVIVGVSGGPDSLALLHVLKRFREEMPFEIHVAHLDHCFRGIQAQEEAAWVKNIALRWGLSCTVERIDVPALAKERGLSSQDAGHLARNEFFLRLQKEIGAQKIALGHHADDQAETLLMRFLTGAGPEGLCGILPVRDSFIRPLLFARRGEIEAYCLEHRLDPRRDPSNEKDIYLRNRVRNKLLPWLTANINPNLVDTLNRTAQIFWGEEELLQKICGESIRSLVFPEAKGIRLFLANFSGLPLAVQRRVVRSAYEMAGKKRGLDFYHVEEVRKLVLDKQVGKILQLPGGVKARKEYESVFLFLEEKTIESGPLEERELAVPGCTCIPETGQTVEISFADRKPAAVDENEAYLPRERFKPPLFARCRRAGDIVFLKGLGKYKKLKELFIDKKIPRRLRNRILLIADQNEVLWIPGIAYGRGVNENSDSGSYVLIKIREQKEQKQGQT
ncbi:MAG: tRNA lysidine(34) synthetase TilS [Peptococcaceae bacterium]|jgi:tRNA(Ile)-lysidine synthase|nr:tRNA lysidine(34) synthetase TilS [Peptococcaceae bacterium]MDH7523705.1 tRNA lysidine(34) synthetase TilS [Peptococcaceae bacterium]